MCFAVDGIYHCSQNVRMLILYKKQRNYWYLYTDYQINSEQKATQSFWLNFFHSENWKVTVDVFIVSPFSVMLLYLLTANLMLSFLTRNVNCVCHVEFNFNNLSGKNCGVTAVLWRDIVFWMVNKVTCSIVRWNEFSDVLFTHIFWYLVTVFRFSNCKI
jgi:hypothetical protein